MKKSPLLLAAIVLTSVMAFNQNFGQDSGVPEYTAQGELKLPEQYREWVYLSTGLDMSYTAGGNPDHHMFDNVFVNPASYRKFQETGSWPDKTMLVLEVRGAERTSINQRGNSQSAEVMGIEVHIKDEAKFPGYNVRAVLSHTASSREKQGNVERGVREGKCGGKEVTFC
jgi:hypothetical protein